MRAGKFAGLALAVSLLTTAGCLQEQYTEEWVAVSPGDGQGDVTLFRDVKFDDIPLPPEFILLPDESYSFQGSQFRSGVFHYQGAVEWTWTLDYLRNELPAMGWNLVETERGFNFRVLKFAKGPERLIVVARQLRNGTKLELQLENIEKNDLLLRGKLPNDR